MPARMGDSAPFSAPYVKLWLLCRTPLCAPRFAFHVHAFQTRSFRRFPLYGDFLVRPPGASPFVKIPSPAARLFPCRKLHRPALLHCAPGQYPVHRALPSMFMLFRHVPCGAFPSAEIAPSVPLALPLSEDSPAARPAFPVSEATPACASALRPRTIPCAPRFTFHVHAFQTRSFRCFPLYGDFPVGPSDAFPSAEIAPSVHLALPPL